jgi:hypothetical protein
MLNSKKIASLVLALAMTTTLAVPAFADGDTDAGEKKEETSSTAKEYATQVDATYQDITIDVTVPTTGTAVINPYGLPYALKDSKSAEIGKVSGQQIVTQPLYISNNSTDVAFDVNATVTTTTSKDLTLATKTTSGTKSTSKEAFVYLEMEPSTFAGKTQVDADTIAKECLDADEELWQTYSASANNFLVLTTAEGGASSKAAMATLAAMTTQNQKDTDGKTDKKDSEGNILTEDVYSDGSVAVFRLAGDCVTAPSTAWSTSDTFSAKIVFTFTPNSEA